MSGRGGAAPARVLTRGASSDDDVVDEMTFVEFTEALMIISMRYVRCVAAQRTSRCRCPRARADGRPRSDKLRLASSSKRHPMSVCVANMFARLNSGDGSKRMVEQARGKFSRTLSFVSS